eukprot:GHRR01023589.1.p1 GENE.GHRR01023589.1~~GHRR01023589.1.p1  ORF type:complete len:344 (+),score=117.29 GHRR01023589.1:359-1390(+)
MVKRPVISILSQQLFNFENGVSIYVHYFSKLVGARFGDLQYLFPDGILMGVMDRVTGKARMAPEQDYILQDHHALVICRPTLISNKAYQPLHSTPNISQLLSPIAISHPASTDTDSSTDVALNTVDRNYQHSLTHWGGSSQIELLRKRAESNIGFSRQGSQLQSDQQTSTNASSIDSCIQNNIIVANISKKLASVSMSAQATAIPDQASCLKQQGTQQQQAAGHSSSSSSNPMSSVSGTAAVVTTGGPAPPTRNWPVQPSSRRGHHAGPRQGDWQLLDQAAGTRLLHQQYDQQCMGNAAHALSKHRAAAAVAAPVDTSLLVPSEYLQVMVYDHDLFEARISLS